MLKVARPWMNPKVNVTMNVRLRLMAPASNLLSFENRVVEVDEVTYLTPTEYRAYIFLDVVTVGMSRNPYGELMSVHATRVEAQRIADEHCRAHNWYLL